MLDHFGGFSRDAPQRRVDFLCCFAFIPLGGVPRAASEKGQLCLSKVCWKTGKPYLW